MKVGLQVLCSNNKAYSDAEMYKNELKLCVEAEAMGFDMLTVVEHHFDDYSMIPDNGQFLSYLAAKTKTIKLMPAAFILPWNDPLRVIEKTVMLDIMSEGRVILGMGRGLARMEFEGLRIPMEESRERFDEAAEMIIRGLETGYAENDGKYYKQPRVEIRPRRVESFKDRSYMVGMSPSSVDVSVKLGLGCIKFSNMPWEDAAPEVLNYKSGFKKMHGVDAPPIVCADFVMISHDQKKAQSYAETYLADYWRTIMDHYEMRKAENFTSASYSNYADAAKELNAAKEEDLLASYFNANLIGTPEQILEKIQKRRELIGDYNITITISCGSMPYDLVWEQTKLFVEEVMPVIKSWGSSSKGQAAAQ